MINSNTDAKRLLSRTVSWIPSRLNIGVQRKWIDSKSKMKAASAIPEYRAKRWLLLHTSTNKLRVIHINISSQLISIFTQNDKQSISQIIYVQKTTLLEWWTEWLMKSGLLTGEVCTRRGPHFNWQKTLHTNKQQTCNYKPRHTTSLVLSWLWKHSDVPITYQANFSKELARTPPHCHKLRNDTTLVCHILAMQLNLK